MKQKIDLVRQESDIMIELFQLMQQLEDNTKLIDAWKETLKAYPCSEHGTSIGYNMPDGSWLYFLKGVLDD